MSIEPKTTTTATKTAPVKKVPVKKVVKKASNTPAVAKTTPVKKTPTKKVAVKKDAAKEQGLETVKSNPVPKKAVKTKKESTPKPTGGLTESQRKVLQALAEHGDSTRPELKKYTGISKGYHVILGAPTKGGLKDNTLEAQGLVVSKSVEGTRALVYTITTAGRKALEA